MRAARVFNRVGDVHVEWRPFGTRIRALAASALVASMGIVSIVVWLFGYLTGITGALIAGTITGALLFGGVIKVNLMLNSMADLGGSGFHADIGEWTQLKMLWDGVRDPVVNNTRYRLDRRSRGRG